MTNDTNSPAKPMWSIEAALHRVLGGATVPLGDSGEFRNVHFRVTTSAGHPMFVKVFDDVDYWQRAIAAAATVAPLLHTPQLLDHGDLGASRWWISYQWLDLEPFAPTTNNLRQIGAMLGRLHASTADATAGFTEHDLDAEIVERADQLSKVDTHAAERIRVLHARWSPIQLPGDIGLIHGDFHWRNVATVNGTPILFDLENVQAARPLVDFGKLIDLHGLADKSQLKTFFSGYEQHASPVWPWPKALRAVRLWTTCGVLVYSLTRGLTDFAAHGYQRLSELETTDM